MHIAFTNQLIFIPASKLAYHKRNAGSYENTDLVVDVSPLRVKTQVSLLCDAQSTVSDRRLHCYSHVAIGASGASRFQILEGKPLFAGLRWLIWKGWRTASGRVEEKREDR